MTFEEWWEEYCSLITENINDPHVKQIKIVAKDSWDAAKENL